MDQVLHNEWAQLPVLDFRDEITRAVDEHQVTIIITDWWQKHTGATVFEEHATQRLSLSHASWQHVILATGCVKSGQRDMR